MSELLDKQVYVLNECFKIEIPRFLWESRMPTKVCDEKRKKKQLPRKIFYGRKDFLWLYQKSGETDFDELRVNNTKGTICLVNG